MTITTTITVHASALLKVVTNSTNVRDVIAAAGGGGGGECHSNPSPTLHALDLTLLSPLCTCDMIFFFSLLVKLFTNVTCVTITAVMMLECNWIVINVCVADFAVFFTRL
jgi:hypothetical protein